MEATRSINRSQYCVVVGWRQFGSKASWLYVVHCDRSKCDVHMCSIRIWYFSQTGECSLKMKLKSITVFSQRKVCANEGQRHVLQVNSECAIPLRIVQLTVSCQNGTLGYPLLFVRAVCSWAHTRHAERHRHVYVFISRKEQAGALWNGKHNIPKECVLKFFVYFRVCGRYLCRVLFKVQ
jgi:hypothetical protein